jgi:hypothetical protein
MEAPPVQQKISPLENLELFKSAESSRWMRWALYGTGIAAGATACWLLYRATGKFNFFQSLGS